MYIIDVLLSNHFVVEYLVYVFKYCFHIFLLKLERTKHFKNAADMPISLASTWRAGDKRRMFLREPCLLKARYLHVKRAIVQCRCELSRLGERDTRHSACPELITRRTHVDYVSFKKTHWKLHPHESIVTPSVACCGTLWHSGLLSRITNH